MPRYKVELLSVSRDDESKDIQFITYTEASDTGDAMRKAKDVQKKRSHKSMKPITGFGSRMRLLKSQRLTES